MTLTTTTTTTPRTTDRIITAYTRVPLHTMAGLQWALKWCLLHKTRTHTSHIQFRQSVKMLPTYQNTYASYAHTCIICACMFWSEICSHAARRTPPARKTIATTGNGQINIESRACCVFSLGAMVCDGSLKNAKSMYKYYHILYFCDFVWIEIKQRYILFDICLIIFDQAIGHFETPSRRSATCKLNTQNHLFLTHAHMCQQLFSFLSYCNMLRFYKFIFYMN